jgi:hypothetical protein
MAKKLNWGKSYKIDRDEKQSMAEIAGLCHGIGQPGIPFEK